MGTGPAGVAFDGANVWVGNVIDGTMTKLRAATGQVLGSVGYNWTKSFSTTLGYRALYTYFRDDNGSLHDYRYQTWTYGPFAGAKYSF